MRYIFSGLAAASLVALNAAPAHAQSERAQQRPGDETFQASARPSEEESEPSGGELERLRRRALENGAPPACPHPSERSGLCNGSPG